MVLFFALMLLEAVSVLIDGIVLYFLWGWFVSPIFSISISLGQAIGLGMVASFATYQNAVTPKTNKSTVELFVEAALVAVVYPFVVLAIGWIIQFFI